MGSTASKQSTRNGTTRGETNDPTRTNRWQHPDHPAQLSPPSQKILLHEGRLASQILLTSKIETFTISTGWTPRTVSAFVQAVEKVVSENAILTSRVTRSLCSGNLYAIPHYHDQHPFVTVTDLSSEQLPSIDGLNYNEQIEWLHAHISPRIKTQAFLIVEMHQRMPLFDANLFLLPDKGTVVYHVNLSHSLGDATTYYMIMEQISAYMNIFYELDSDDRGNSTKSSGVPLPPLPKTIVWNNPHLTTQEMSPAHYSARDCRRSSGSTLVVGAIRQGTQLPKRVNRPIRHYVLCRNKIAQKKAELVGPTCDYLSSHDVVLAAVSQCNTTALDVFMFASRRPRLPDLYTLQDGGICLAQFSLPRTVATDPNEIRQAVNRGYYYDTNSVPSEPTGTGRIIVSTSWATRACFLQGCGDTIATVCHVPTLGMFYVFPFDLAIIWAVNDDCLGVVHNFDNSTSDLNATMTEDPSALLHSLVADKAVESSAGDGPNECLYAAVPHPPSIFTKKVKA
jgi:hypothetical protein